MVRRMCGLRSKMEQNVEFNAFSSALRPRLLRKIAIILILSVHLMLFSYPLSYVANDAPRANTGRTFCRPLTVISKSANNSAVCDPRIFFSHIHLLQHGIPQAGPHRSIAVPVRIRLQALPAVFLPAYLSSRIYPDRK